MMVEDEVAQTLEAAGLWRRAASILRENASP